MTKIWSMILLFAAACGIWLMIDSYDKARDASGIGDKRYILFVAEKPEAKAEKGTPVEVYFLTPANAVEMMADRVGGMFSTQGKSFLRNHQEKVILFADFEQRFSKDMLEWGRLPTRGANEVLAEPTTNCPDRITVGNRALQVVGMLKKTDSLQQDAYYAADDPALRKTIDAEEQAILSGFLVSWEKIDEIQGMKKLFPREQFTAVAGSPRLEKNTFYSYTAGMMLFVFGGSALLIQGYLLAARRITNAWLGPPLAEINRHWKLFSLLHLVYFGIYSAGCIVIYESPLVQDFVLMVLRGQIESESGVLGVAGLAYKSGSIPLAATTTLVINFFIGSLLVITLPSLIVPGIGLLMILVRAALWGIVLAPTLLTLAGGMIFHSGTLLLEGEGYILAAFFAILVPIYLFSAEAGDKLKTRYARALMMNIKGNLLVLIVLAVAATYEAIEVILQMRG